MFKRLDYVKAKITLWPQTGPGILSTRTKLPSSFLLPSPTQSHPPSRHLWQKAVPCGRVGCQGASPSW